MAARRRTTRRKRVTRRRRTTKRRVTRRKRVVRRRRKAKRVSIRGTRAQVWRGSRTKVKTTGQTKSDLMKSKSGKIISKAAYKAGQKAYKRNGLKKWITAFMQARKKWFEEMDH